MLVLSRKKGEEVVITVGNQVIRVVVTDIQPGKVRLGFDADSSVIIHRKEVQEKVNNAVTFGNNPRDGVK